MNRLLKKLKPLILKLMKTNGLIILITSGEIFFRLKVKNLAFKSLVEENNTKEKTKHIEFKELKISEYLRQIHRYPKIFFPSGFEPLTYQFAMNGNMMTMSVLPAKSMRKI